MKKYFVIAIVVNILLLSCGEKSKVNNELRDVLNDLYYKDQAVRQLYFSELSKSEKDKILDDLKLDSLTYKDEMWSVMRNVDSLNFITVESIVKEYGYPGKSLVGDSTYKAAWYILHHSDSVEKYLPLIKSAAEMGELEMTNYAMTFDRCLMGKGEEQLYGTQGAQYMDGYVIWPIQNLEEVNKRRKLIGFETTIEEYARILGFEYSPITLIEMNKYRESLGMY